MTHPSDRRTGLDRRSQARGGRRPTDRSGYAPLVLVVDEDSHVRDLCELILAKLRFAVTPATSIDQARRVMTALQPEIIVARAREADALRAEAPHNDRGAIPVVAVADDGPDADVLIGDIRRALGSVAARA